MGKGGKECVYSAVCCQYTALTTEIVKGCASNGTCLCIEQQCCLVRTATPRTAHRALAALPSAVCRLPSAVCRLPSAVCLLPSASVSLRTGSCAYLVELQPYCVLTIRDV